MEPVINPNQVKGWGLDADPNNDPTYPMKKHTALDHAGYSWARPVQQPPTVEVLHSNERPNLPAVFGTSTPPSGLSGMLRRFAFRYSESSYGHWLPLMFADRVGVVEGIVGDVAKGHIPNLWEETGANVQWRYNQKKMVTGVVLGAAAVSLVAIYLQSRKADVK